MTVFYMMIAAGVGALLLIAVMRNRIRAARADASAERSSNRPTHNTD